MGDEIRRAVEEQFDEQPEVWSRHPDEGVDRIRAVSAARIPRSGWSWCVTVEAMEFCGDEPFEPAMRRELLAAMAAVPGVTAVAEEDREVWGIEGEADPRLLVAGTAAVVDRYADQVRAVLDRYR